MEKNDLISSLIRKDIIGELETINTYEEHSKQTNDLFVKKVLLDIASEEKVHVGELLSLLSKISPKDADALKKGNKELEEIYSSIEDDLEEYFDTNSDGYLKSEIDEDFDDNLVDDYLYDL